MWGCCRTICISEKRLHFYIGLYSKTFERLKGRHSQFIYITGLKKCVASPCIGLYILFIYRIELYTTCQLSSHFSWHEKISFRGTATVFSVNEREIIVLPRTPFLNKFWKYFRPDTISLLTCKRTHASSGGVSLQLQQHYTFKTEGNPDSDKDQALLPWSLSLSCSQLPPSA